MAASSAATPDAYLAEQPPERAQLLERVRSLVDASLPPGYEQRMNWGMICWELPLQAYPETYNKQPLGVVALASQKNHMALYLMGVYAVPGLEDWLRRQYDDRGLKLDMGKSCLRFKSLDQLPLDVIGEVVARVTPEAYIAAYESARAGTAKGR